MNIKEFVDELFGGWNFIKSQKPAFESQLSNILSSFTSNQLRELLNRVFAECDKKPTVSTIKKMAFDKNNTTQSNTVSTWYGEKDKQEQLQEKAYELRNDYITRNNILKSTNDSELRFCIQCAVFSSFKEQLERGVTPEMCSIDLPDIIASAEMNVPKWQQIKKNVKSFGGA